MLVLVGGPSWEHSVPLGLRSPAGLLLEHPGMNTGLERDRVRWSSPEYVPVDRPFCPIE